jgi:hypothetical protein
MKWNIATSLGGSLSAAPKQLNLLINLYRKRAATGRTTSRRGFAVAKPD